MSHRSVSQLNTFSECGERYRLERTLSLPPRPAAWTALGNGMHSAVEIWERSDRIGELAELFWVHYNEEIERLTALQPDLKQWIKTPNVKTVERDIDLRGEHGVKQANSLETARRSAPWKVASIGGQLALELPLTLTFGDVRVIGKVDLVKEWPNGTLSVEDTKTGAKKGTRNRQLGFYGLALNEMYGLHITHGEFWYTKLGASGGYVDLNRYNRPYLHDQFNKLDSAINQELYLANPGDHCTFCDVRQYCREEGTP